MTNISQEQIREQLLIEMSKANINIIIAEVLKNTSLFPALFELMFDDDLAVARRAAWTVEHCFLINNELLSPYLKQLIEVLPTVKHTSLARHFLKMLAYSDISAYYTGELIDLCFQWIISNEQPIAVKIFAMDLLYKSTNVYPELKTELKETIELILPNASAGTKNRGQKTINKLNKEIKAL